MPKHFQWFYANEIYSWQPTDTIMVPTVCTTLHIAQMCGQGKRLGAKWYFQKSSEWGAGTIIGLRMPVVLG